MIKRNLRRQLGRWTKTHASFNEALCVFVYHDVSDYPSEFCKLFRLNVPSKLFSEQMDFIKDHFYIVNPDELLRGDYPTPAAMITFDDGMQSYFQEAIPIMLRKNIPSIIFLNMAPIEGEIFWSGLITFLSLYQPGFQNLLSKLFPDKRKEVSFLFCNEEIVQDYLRSIDYHSLKKEVQVFYGNFATGEDLDSVRDNPLVYFGNHLYNHYNAKLLSRDKLMQQYLINEQKISRYKNARKFFAYPFGQLNTCFSGKETDYLFSLGAEFIFYSNGDINRKNQDRFLDRIGIDSHMETIEDLFGRIQGNRIKSFLV